MKGLGSGGALQEASKRWKRMNRFDRAVHLIENFRTRRGASNTPVSLDDPTVGAVFSRIYGIEPRELDLSKPESALHKVLKRWGEPERTSVEVTVIAPGAGGLDVADMERRGVHFYLIEAELRRSERNGVTERAILHWNPVHRTQSVDGTIRADVIAFRNAIVERDPGAAGFRWRPAPRCVLQWDNRGNWFVRINRTDHVLKTEAEWLTEGLAAVKSDRKAGLRKLEAQLQHFGVRRAGAALVAPWNAVDLRPAVELTATYYKLGTDTGAIDPHGYRWAARPT